MLSRWLPYSIKFCNGLCLLKLHNLSTLYSFKMNLKNSFSQSVKQFFLNIQQGMQVCLPQYQTSFEIKILA